MVLTPRQLMALLFVARRRKRRDQRETLLLQAIGAQGDKKAIEDMLRKLERD